MVFENCVVLIFSVKFDLIKKCTLGTIEVQFKNIVYICCLCLLTLLQLNNIFSLYKIFKIAVNKQKHLLIKK